jgi:hypothetical protein
MRTTLTGEQTRALAKVLAGTLSFAELESVVYASTGDRLYVEYVSQGDPLRPTIEKLLNALEQIGITSNFLAYVYRLRREHKPDVADAIRNIMPEAAVDDSAITGDIAVQTAGAPQPGGPTKAAAPGLERNVRPYLAQLDLHIWLGRLAAIERQVCRVEIAGNAAGTGFLVGPSAVLTNWHVVESSFRDGKLHDVACRFDYYRLADNTRQEGILFPVSAEGCVSHRKYSPAEATATPDDPAPTEDQLDYALLQLGSRAGESDIGGRARGWVAMPTSAVALKAGSPLLIVQHPDGGPLKLALDTNAVIGLSAGGLRIRYATNTEAGSSGSPCFEMDWRLTALHHYGDPAWLNPKYNQGVPVDLIRAKIVADGFAGLLSV